MMRPILILLLWMGWTFAAPLQRIALFGGLDSHTKEKERQQTAMALRLGLEQTQLFRILLPEEIQESYVRKGVLPPTSCIVESCYRNYAEVVDAQLVLEYQIQTMDNHYDLILRLRNPVGEVVESARYRAIKGDLPLFLRTSIASFFGTTPPSPAYAMERTELPSPPSYGKWATGALGVAATYALAAWKMGDLFLIRDINKLDTGFTVQKDGSYQLSGVPGFFFSMPSPDARSRAMGRSGVALHMNPAGLSRLQKPKVSFSNAKLPAEAGQQLLGQWNSPFRPGIWWGHSLRFEGDELASEMAFQTSFAMDFALISNWLHGMQGGVHLRALALQVGKGGTGKARSTGSGLGSSMDVGLQWTLWDGPRLGAQFTDILSFVSYHNTLTNSRYQEDLPTQLTLGISWLSPLGTLFAFDLDKAILEGQQDHMKVGLEQELFNALFLRAGWYKSLSSSVDLWSIGGGIRLQQGTLHMRMDLAMELGQEPYDAFAGQQILSVSVEF